MKIGQILSRLIVLRPIYVSVLFASIQLYRLRATVPACFLRWYWTQLNRFALHHGLPLTAATIWGDRIRCNTREFQQKHIAIFGMWEPKTTNYILSRPNSRGLFIDIGANIGFYSLLASRRFEKVVSFEASPTIYKKLLANIHVNLRGNIETHNIFVSSRGGSREFFRGPDHNLGLSSHIRAHNSSSEGHVPTANLNDFISAADMSAIKMIKIDVEGAEREIADWILSSLPGFNDQLEIIMEFSPPKNPADRSNQEMFLQFVNNGFAAFVLQGPYSFDEYIEEEQKFTSLGHRIYECPRELTDVLFKRNETVG